MCQTLEESREFESLLMDEEGQISEKKRRLSVDQVKALEKYFEVENKLEPERKVKLAQELGLQPRQVAVWFQNRRARWKTKQLEGDYGVLKASFDLLKDNYELLKKDNDSLLKQMRELKSKLYGESNIPMKEPTEGSSDSDSSAILNEDNNRADYQQLTDPKPITGDAYEPQFVKIEEHDFFSGDESCNFFSDDQAPTLQWYCQDQWGA